MFIPNFATSIWINSSLTFRKSTFFNVLTKSQASAENFPFCTIDPNESKYLLISSQNLYDTEAHLLSFQLKKLAKSSSW
jgi:hypothetical protein